MFGFMFTVVCLFVCVYRSKTLDTKLEEDNMGHQMLKKMGKCGFGRTAPFSK